MRIKRTVLGTVLRYLILTVFAVLFVWPFVWMISASLKTSRTYYVRPVHIFFPDPAWGNYANVWQKLTLSVHTKNSIIVAGSIAVLQVLTSCPAAFAFATLRFPLKRALFTLVMVTMMLPACVMLVPLFFIVQKMGLMNTYAGMILPFAFTGFGIFLMRQSFLSLPRDLFTAAEIDGAGYLRILVQIYAPLAKSSVMTLLTLSFIGSFNSVLWPQIVASKPSIMVLSVRLIASLNFDSMLEPYKFMAIATLCTIPPVALFASLQKLYVKGYIMSGLKA
jgi:multiple sugar transport system permease protein